nr:uncharacterized protein LOC113819572 [Penaeus vannamei]
MQHCHGIITDEMAGGGVPFPRPALPPDADALRVLRAPPRTRRRRPTDGLGPAAPLLRSPRSSRRRRRRSRRSSRRHALAMLCLKQMGDTAASPPGDDLRLARGDSASDEGEVDGADGGEPAAGGGGRRHNNTLARALCGLLASLADRLKCGRQNRKRQVRE